MNFWSLLLKILGWKIYGENFISPRSVIAVAPHTSYLDGVIGFIAMKAMKIRFRTISAERLFFFPFQICDEVCLECHSLWSSFRKFYQSCDKDVQGEW